MGCKILVFCFNGIVTEKIVEKVWVTILLNET